MDEEDREEEENDDDEESYDDWLNEAYVVIDEELHVYIAEQMAKDD